MSRPVKLSREQRAELRRRYALWRANVPKRLAADFGISSRQVAKYVHHRFRDEEVET